jgi:ATP-dependent RNA helicase HelY
MPARSVVIEKLTKFTGETHEFLSPAQYTQLTGRAGRRGIDDHGQAVVLWSPYVQFDQVANLALSKQFVLSSSFRPTYNMAANLVRRYSPERARQLLNLSFAQFRVDAGVVKDEHRIERLTERRHKLVNSLESDFGPIGDLRAAALTPGEATVDEQEISSALARLAPGDVVRLREVAGRSGSTTATSVVAVLSVAFRRRGRIRVVAVGSDGEGYEIDPKALLEPPEVVGKLELPEPYLPNSVTFAHEVAELLKRTRVTKASRSAKGPKPKRRISENEPESSSRPAYTSRSQLPTPAVRGLKRLDKIEGELARIRSASARRVDSLAGQFDRVINLLVDRGHLNGWDLAPSGERIARLYHESDLLIVECLEAGLFDGLGAPEVAALASVFVYEERRSTGAPTQPWYPSADLRRRFRQIQAMHLDLTSDEADDGLTPTRAPDPGFVAIAHGWASGVDLDEILVDEVLTAGDFVRTVKQLIDLLRQIGLLAPSAATAGAARSAAETVRRDLVAVSSMVDVDDGDTPESNLDSLESDESPDATAGALDR